MKAITLHFSVPTYLLNSLELLIDFIRSFTYYIIDIVNLFYLHTRNG